MMPTTALAHSVDKRFGDFYGGMLHPLTVLGQLLPLIGLSLLAGQHGAKNARWVLIALPFGFLTGAVGGLYGSPSPEIEWINLASLLVVGIAVAAAIRLPFLIFVGAAFLLGISHGYANVVDISTAVARQLFLPGLAASIFALTAIGAAITVRFQGEWQTVAVRIAGSWIAAIGLLMIAAA